MQIKEYHKKIASLGNMDITIRVMTPDGYESGEGRYPAVYINDGQDVFRDEDILWGECSMDYENYYRLHRESLPDVIIVALVCPEDRQERTILYSPFTCADKEGHGTIAGRGKEYLEWITGELKPWVDRAYRTIPLPEETAIMGYSTGGLFAIYAALSRPGLFSRVAAMSSAVYIWMDSLKEFLENAEFSHLKRIYMDVGTNEFGRITTKEEFMLGADMMYGAYLQHGVPAEIIRYHIYPGAVHSQREWKGRFPGAMRWIFSDRMKGEHKTV